jgi:hypothetical protein
MLIQCVTQVVAVTNQSLQITNTNKSWHVCAGFYFFMCFLAKNLALPLFYRTFAAIFVNRYRSDHFKGLRFWIIRAWKSAIAIHKRAMYTAIFDY